MDREKPRPSEPAAVLMLRRQARGAVLGAIALCLGVESPAVACSCARVLSVEQEFAVCQSVFVGRVMARYRDQIELAPGDKMSAYRFVFEVQRVYKGATKLRISVTTGLGRGDCGYPFEIGKQYLVYAGGEKRLETSICTRTRPLAWAGADLSKLGAPQTIFVPVPMLSFAAAAGIVVCVLILEIVIGIHWRKETAL